MLEYNEFLLEINTLKKVSVDEANKQTMKILDSSYFDDDWDINKRLKIYEILDLVKQYKLNGDAYDFHNYAVTFAKINDFDATCDIIELGLNRFPSNVDLLADFLEYAPRNSDEDRFVKCESYLGKLKGINMNLWTWRSFCFLIDYMLEKLNQNINQCDEIKDELLDISEKYIEKFPLDERAYYSAYLIYKSFGLNDDISKLRLALSLPIRASHCALALSELLFEKKQYRESLDTLNRAIKDGIDVKGSLKYLNIYLLRFTIKAALLMEKIVIEDNLMVSQLSEDLQKEVKDAYSDYMIAVELGIDDARQQSISQYIKILEILTKVTNESEL